MSWRRCLVSWSLLISYPDSRTLALYSLDSALSTISWKHGFFMHWQESVSLAVLTLPLYLPQTSCWLRVTTWILLQGRSWILSWLLLHQWAFGQSFKVIVDLSYFSLSNLSSESTISIVMYSAFWIAWERENMTHWKPFRPQGSLPRGFCLRSFSFSA